MLAFLDFVDRVPSDGGGSLAVSILFLIVTVAVLAWWLSTGRP
jgi:hypothetical protein